MKWFVTEPLHRDELAIYCIDDYGNLSWATVIPGYIVVEMEQLGILNKEKVAEQLAKRLRPDS